MHILIKAPFPYDQQTRLNEIPAFTKYCVVSVSLIAFNRIKPVGCCCPIHPCSPPTNPSNKLENKVKSHGYFFFCIPSTLSHIKYGPTAFVGPTQISWDTFKLHFSKMHFIGVGKLTQIRYGQQTALDCDHAQFIVSLMVLRSYSSEPF